MTYVAAVTGQGRAGRILEQALALMGRSSDALPIATVLSAALALCGPLSAPVVLAAQGQAASDVCVCGQVDAGLLCLVCPVNVLLRLQAAACLP